MSEKSDPPIHNKLLAALPGKEYKRLVPLLEPVSLEFKAVLSEPNAPFEHAYFPNGDVISLLIVMEDGVAREVGLIGNEGMLGLAALAGAKTTPFRALVQLPGTGMRIKVKVLRDEFRRGGALQDLLLLYTQTFFTQVSLTAACGTTHNVDQRLCRWLLMTHDRAGAAEFEMTQEFMGVMLGVTRTFVSRTARALQRAGLIKYSRGKVQILDRKKLEASACSCYHIVEQEYRRLLTK